MKHTARGIAVARNSAPYSPKQIDHGRIPEAKDLTSKDPDVSMLDRKNPEDKSVNTLARYGKYQTPSSMAKKARRKKFKRI